jgi:hypothetical protein
MKRTGAIVLAAALSIPLLAGTAAAAPPWPKNWTCTEKPATPGTYSCVARVTVKAGASHLNYLWATKECQAKVKRQAAAMGVPSVSVVSGADQIKGRTWRCGALFSITPPQ